MNDVQDYWNFINWIFRSNNLIYLFTVGDSKHIHSTSMLCTFSIKNHFASFLPRSLGTVSVRDLCDHLYVRTHFQLVHTVWSSRVFNKRMNHILGTTVAHQLSSSVGNLWFCLLCCAVVNEWTHKIFMNSTKRRAATTKQKKAGKSTIFHWEESFHNNNNNTIVYIDHIESKI